MYPNGLRRAKPARVSRSAASRLAQSLAALTSRIPHRQSRTATPSSLKRTIMASKAYAQLQKQIASLQQEADALKRREVEEVIAKIKDAIAVYGLTASDLGLRGKG